MAGEVEAYQKTVEALATHNRALGDVYAKIMGFAEDVKRVSWSRIVPNGYEVTRKPPPLATFEPKSWPTGESIAKQIQTLHTLEGHCEAAKAKLSAEQRAAVHLPK